MRAALCLFLAWLGSCAVARADGAGVVLFERAALRPRLCAALRIQLSGTAQVHCQPEGQGDALDARIARAAAEVQRQQARLGVLLERDPDPAHIRMYLVSTSARDALVAIESIEDRPEPDVDRSLALKVLDAYEVMGVTQVALQHAAPLAAALVEPPAAMPRWRVFLEAGGGPSLGLHTRVVGNLLLGVARMAGPLQFELALGARLASRVSARSDAGRVELAEQGAQLGLRVASQRGRFVLGGACDLLLARIAAEGSTATGKRGARTQAVPGLALAVDLRVRLFASAYLRFAPGVEVSLIEQRWAVDQQTVLNQGRVAALLPLSLHLSLPLSRAADRHSP